MTMPVVPVSTTEKKHMTANRTLTHSPLKAQIITFLITQVSHSVNGRLASHFSHENFNMASPVSNSIAREQTNLTLLIGNQTVSRLIYCRVPFKTFYLKQIN